MSEANKETASVEEQEVAAQVEPEVAAPEAEEQATDPVAELEKQLEEARKKADENWDVALRTKAEMENIKRRTEKEVDNARKFALEKLANELLAVRDSMELGLDAAKAENADLEKLLEGSELTLKMLVDVMGKFNIVQLNPEGEAFNPDHHQAISMLPSEEHEPNTVMSVMQKGYLLNDRLLRPAMVVVSKK